MSTFPLRVGILGCGNISGEYLKGLSQSQSVVHVTACADLLPERARDFSNRHGIYFMEVDALLASPEVDILLNLTPPKVHYSTSLVALQNGKHVYSEKPLAIEFLEGKALLDLAASKGVIVGCAPDTFLGRGLQTCIQTLYNKTIGEPIAASAFMVCHGHEDWHPSPDFYYQPGGGPLFDMGPYYLTALVCMLGSIHRVTAFARPTFKERMVTSDSANPHRIKVDVNTHYTVSLEFKIGVLATMIMSFDIWQATLPPIEIYGSEGTLSCPDPNTFDGPVNLIKPKGEVVELPLVNNAAMGRGAGLIDMAESIRDGRKPRASGNLALHVLEAMTAIDLSARSDQVIELTTTIE